MKRLIQHRESYLNTMVDFHCKRTAYSIDISAAASTNLGRKLQKNGFAAYEKETLALAAALIDCEKIRGMADIGANIGIYSWLMKSIFGGRLYVQAYEPLPALARIARKIAQQNRLRINVISAAVGAQTGEATLYISRRSDLSNSLQQGFRPAKDKITVPVVCLDEAFAHFSPRLIKIDTETTEPDVIAGGERFIARVRPWMIVEVLGPRNEEALQAFAERHDYLTYHITGQPFGEPQKIRGDLTYAHRDWLFAPCKIKPDFNACYRQWLESFKNGTIVYPFNWRQRLHNLLNWRM